MSVLGLAQYDLISLARPAQARTQKHPIMRCITGRNKPFLETRSTAGSAAHLENIMDLTTQHSGLRSLFVLTTLGLIGSGSASAQATFFATQYQGGSTTKLYRFTATGNIDTFITNQYVTGLTTVPTGMSVGNLNGGAKGGDVIGSRGGLFFRLDDAFGTNPHWVQIGAGANVPNASPFFSGSRLMTVGAALPAGAYLSEFNPTDFSFVSQEAMGVLGSANAGYIQPSGKVWYLDHNYDRLYEYTPGSGVSTHIGTLPNHDYSGWERYNGTNYVMLGLNPGGSGRFVLGQIDAGGNYSQLRDIDVHNFNGQTGLTIAQPVPEPGTLAALGLGVAFARRRLRRG